MSMLPANTFLGNLEIVEIYEYYDRPLLFVCRNASDSLYLVVLSEQDDESETWLYVAMSERRFHQVRSGGIDLNSAFRHAEDNSVTQVKVYLREDFRPEVTLIPASDLADDQLPQPGESLDLETITLAQTNVSIQHRASSLLREYVELSLELPGKRRNEAPILVISNIMLHLQEALVSIGHSLSDLQRSSKTPSRDLRQKLELSLLDVSAGSFKLEMASSESTDMFGDTLIGDALDEFARLVRIGSVEEDLETAFRNYKPSVPKDYLELLKSIKQSRIDRASLRWASANGERTGETHFAAPMVIATIDTIEQMDVTEIKLITVRGRLTGAFTYRTFEIETREETYSGKLDTDSLTDEAIELVNNAQLGKYYQAKLREEKTLRVATNETKTRYFLVDLQEYNL